MPRARSTIAKATAPKVPKVAEASRLSSSQNQKQDASATLSSAPTGRNIPAQGNALGSRHPKNPSPEGAAQAGKWPIVPLSDLAVSMKNGIYKHASAYAEDGIPCLRMYNIDDGRIVWKDIKRMRLTSAELDDYGLLPGDLLVNRVNSRELVGKTAPIPDGLGPCVFESKNIRVRLDQDRVDPKWVSYKLLLDGSRYFDRNAQQVVGMASINQGQLGDFQLPFPPLPEQRRIVARIEELFSRLDAGVAALRHAKAQLQRYRQSVLAAAVTGQLTQEWREQHPDTEPAAKLLESILSERRLNWRGRGKYEVPVKPEGVFDELPASWEPITFGHICQVQGGFAFKSNDFVSEGINLVKIASLRAGKVDLDHNPTYLPADYLAEYSRFSLRKGDTLIAMSGATTGKMGVYESEDPALLNQRVGRFLPYTKTNVTAGFLSLLVEQIGDRVLKEAYGAAQPNISPTEIEEMPFPLPPLAEQHQIVAEVEARTTAIDHLAADLDRQITRSNRLRQSTLGSAFEGNL